jgi:5-oxoprolinase (ATP-hydrolysing)
MRMRWPSTWAGTTAKACLIEGGELAVAAELEAAREHRFTRGSGLPIRTPVVDLIEIGAGGGSVAAVNEVGLMKVGPRSAGSVPGPACYGAGGAEPTVTDAALILGYYDPAYFLGGRMALDRAAAERALAPLAKALGLTVPEAAAGIHTLVVENMAAAARMHAVERGRDPRGYAMIAFGGAGPAHAAAVAQALGLAEVIVPPGSGTASALGFLSAPLSFETVRSVVLPLAPGGLAGAAGVLEALEAECRASLATAGGVPPGATVQRTADMRLVGQRHTVSVPLPDGGSDDGTASDLRAAFDTVYAARYAPPPEGAAAEVVALRVGIAGPARGLSPQAGDARGTALKGHRPAWFGGGYVDTPVYDRYALAPGTEIAGPAIVEEAEATTVVPPSCRLAVDGTGCLRITLGPPVRTDLGITANLPLDEAKARIEADPTALEIMWSRAVTVTEEMWHTVCRTAFSLVISEAQDFACDLLDIHGETLAHSPRAMPVFNLTLPIAARALLKAFPVDTLRPGDVLLTNDPWLCAGHLFDIAVVTPVFRDGRVVALAGTVGNVSDIGGTRDWLHAREVYEEGFQIPPMKLVDAGVPNRTLLTLLEKNVRGADQVVGDIFSFVAANEIAARGLLALMDDYGMADLTAFAAVVQGRSEAAMRAAIRALPDGEHRGEAWTTPFGVPMQLPVKVTVHGDAMHIDFAGAPPQVGQGGINCTMSYTAAHATYPLKCMLTPEVRGNAGCYRPFTVAAPEGSILNARYPASVNLRTRTGWYIAPAVFSALAPAAPGRVQAGTGLPFTSNIYGTTPAGERFADVLFTGGGQGASAGRPGRAGLLWPTSASNTSIEVFESRVPVLVIEKSFLPGTGGAGVHPGGDAQRVRFRKRDDDGHAIFATIYPEGTVHPPQGLFGGTSGTAAAAIVVEAGSGRVLRDCGTGALLELTRPIEIIEVTVAGGGGFGAPEPGSGDGGSAEAAAGAKDNSRDRIDRSTQEVNEHA